MLKIKIFVLISLLLASSYAMTIVGSIHGFSHTIGCYPHGNYAYLLYGRCVAVLDIRTPSSVAFVDSICFGDEVLDFDFGYDSLAFLGCGSNIYVFNISDPTRLVRVHTISLPSPAEYAASIVFNNGHIYVATGSNLHVYRLTVSPTGIRDTLTYSELVTSKIVDADSNYLALVVLSSPMIGTTVKTYDIRTPSRPRLLGTVATLGRGGDVDVWGSRIYAANGIIPIPGAGGEAVLVLASTPTRAYTCTTGSGDCNHGCAWGEYFAIANGLNGVRLYNWENPSSPRLVDLYVPMISEYYNNIEIQYPYIFATIRDGLMIFRSDSLPSIGDRTPPRATLVEPLSGSFSACSLQCIKYVVVDSGGAVDWSSVVVEVNSTLYGDTALTIIGDTVMFVPSSSWSEGDTIRFSLISARDTAGNAALGLPLSGFVAMDYSPPVIFDITPASGETVYTAFPVIKFHVVDSLSGVGYFEVVVAGDTFDPSSPEVTFDGDSVVYIPTVPVPRGSVTVCAYASDNVIYCGPNETPPFCWTFYNGITSSDTIPPEVRLLRPLDGTATSDSFMPIVFYIHDDSGVHAASIVLNVNGDLYTLYSSALTYTADTLRFEPHTPYPEGENTVTLSPVSDIYGNATTTYSFSFKADYTPPTQLNMYPIPGSHLDHDTLTVDISLIDPNEGSGIDTASIRFYINDTLVDPVFVPVSDTLVRLTYFYDGRGYSGDTVRIALTNLRDLITYGSYNYAPELRYWFTIEHSAVREVAKPTTPFIETTPNPFNQTALVRVSLGKMEHGKLLLMDINGRIVRTLLEGKIERAEVTVHGDGLTSGVYILKWEGESKLSSRMLLMK